MKQRHSYSNLLYHLVFCTKNREHVISNNALKNALYGFLKVKAHEIDDCIIEFGGWYDHVHLLIRTRPSMALSETYRHLKGFSSRAWHKEFPEHPFAWGDGAFSVTADPEDCEELRSYIRRQQMIHNSRTAVKKWEPED